MKKIIIFIIFLSIILSCKSNDNSTLLKKINFNDKFINDFINKNIKVNISQMEIMDNSDKKILFNGLSFELPQQKAYDLVIKNQDLLLSKEYFIFLSELKIKVISKNDYYVSYIINIIKENNKYKSLELMKTAAVNYDIDNKKIIKKLQEWDKEYKIKIYGALIDSVFIGFENIPSNLENYSKEVYEFCPDAVDQNYGSIEELINDIKNNKYLYLWWD